MKKTIFTICSIVLVCCAIIMACAKDDNSITHVTYAAQSSGGTGTNPDPNHTATSSGATTSSSTTSGTTSGTTTSSTTTPTVYSVTLTTTGSPATGTISATCGTNTMYGSCNNSQIGMVVVQFSAAPTAGNYSVVTSNPTASQVIVSYNGNNYASTGTVAVTVVGGKNVFTFNNVAGTSPTFTLAGGFGCP